MTDKTKVKLYGTFSTEANSDVEHFEPETHINVPHEEAIEKAKEWVDQNEL